MLRVGLIVLLAVAVGAEAKELGFLEYAEHQLSELILNTFASAPRSVEPYISLNAATSTRRSSTILSDGPGHPGGGWIRKEECTSAIPSELSVFGLQDVCADLRLEPCQSSVGVGVRFSGSDDFIFRQSFSADSHETCQAAENLTSALQYACGNDVELCVNFMRNGQPSLRIGENFLTGCPTVTIKSCVPPFGVEVPDMELPLDCFTLGKECSSYATCDHCVENDCGWCSSTNKCMAGGWRHPWCETCGGQDGCDCSWNYGSCPVAPKEIDAQQEALKNKQTQLSGLDTKLENLITAVTEGKDVKVGDTKYQCHTPGEMRSEGSVSITVTVVVGILSAMVAVAAGAFVGKKGYADDLFSRIQLPQLPGRRGEDQQTLTTESSDYVPPAV
mmetsp:Transcript_38448/g.60013  ORF Transcript_38448/g.60013 Transcript_38448/m.60013 type:complete len:389 (-) Transcript_38448:4774-5940(-)